MWRLGPPGRRRAVRPRTGRRPDLRRRARPDRADGGRHVLHRLRRRGGRRRHPGRRGRHRRSSVPRVVLWSLAMTLVFAAPAIAIGSGRAAIWATFVPAVVRQGVGARAIAILDGLPRRLDRRLPGLAGLRCRRGGHDDEPAAPRGRATASSTRSSTAASCPTRPSSPARSCSAPASRSAATPWSRRASSCSGRCPCFALLAALPDAGAPGALVSSLVWLPAARRRARDDVVAAAASDGALAGGRVARVRRRDRRPASPSPLLASVAGGAAGPGRMQHVGPFVPDVLVAAITAFGIGGLLGALVMTWWQRRDALDSAE